ncbi:MAG TPA: hypothetical protein VI612_01485 [Candidatus Nanoarchaeia archaeon]|nr:hypothetical protein [Candidatus Nanoarchaeia archaeon]
MDKGHIKIALYSLALVALLLVFSLALPITAEEPLDSETELLFQQLAAESQCSKSLNKLIEIETKCLEKTGDQLSKCLEKLAEGKFTKTCEICLDEGTPLANCQCSSDSECPSGHTCNQQGVCEDPNAVVVCGGSCTFGVCPSAFGNTTLYTNGCDTLTNRCVTSRTDAAGASLCPEDAVTGTCTDTTDNDADGLRDCNDPGCCGDSACGNTASICAGTELVSNFNCNDGLDNDGDGNTDCADSGCIGQAGCPESTSAGNCADGFDNDGDGFADCADSGCAGTLGCTCGSICMSTPNQTINCPMGLSCSVTTGTGVCVSASCTESNSAGNCGDGFDNDNDGSIDCADSGCTCTNEIFSNNNCADFQDNDNDGFLDCADNGCFVDAACSTETHLNSNCNDGIDNDADSLSDCADPGCGQATNCQESPANNNCNDNIDNDHDTPIGNSITLRDCHDSGCFGSVGCSTETFFTGTFCNDGFDNDNDGNTDCIDPDCFNDVTCAERDTNCYDGKDNDGDSAVDATDSDCAFFVVENNGNGCIDGIDNDGNGQRDCLDSACTGGAYCQENGFSCFNGLDDDGNGLTDCNDGGCLAGGACTTETGHCVDQIDNDNDGLLDCVDTIDCGSASLCVCTDSDGGGGITGSTVGTFGFTLIGGAPPFQRFDYCDPVGINPATGPLKNIRESDCGFAFSQGHTMYEISPGRGFIDCTQITNPGTGQPFTGCVNGVCV